VTQGILRAIQLQLGPDAVVSSRLLPAAEGEAPASEPVAEAKAEKAASANGGGDGDGDAAAAESAPRAKASAR
jgi:hypothetical protein